MKKLSLIFSLVMYIVCSTFGQTELKHGLIAGMGKGRISNLKYTAADKRPDFIFSDKYSINFQIGYRLRFLPVNKPYFYDIDLSAGLKSISIYFPLYSPNSNNGFGVENDARFHASLNMSFNYKIIKGLSVGLGIEPTLYLMTDNPQKFDIPLVPKIAYNFRFAEIALAYKYGFTNVLKSDNFKSGKLQDWQIQLFIPF